MTVYSSIIYDSIFSLYDISCDKNLRDSLLTIDGIPDYIRSRIKFVVTWPFALLYKT